MHSLRLCTHEDLEMDEVDRTELQLIMINIRLTGLQELLMSVAGKLR